ncbi:sigma D regulator [Marinomonas sp. 2405UD68-3]|uniref:sigma D regulator n=1 Tax=Marinomonas sp. 2405UD68-3 TaxID=3391835 RepID=UPI0039C99264
MLESCKSAQERWGGVHDMIDRWLEQRRFLIEEMVQLRKKGTFTPIETPTILAVCEKLIDYVSAGHFEIYEQLALEAKEFHDDRALMRLTELLPDIEETTTIAVEFNDKFDTKEHCDVLLSELPFALQTLGVVMAERFGLEDQLIQELHEAHNEKSA